MSSTSHTISAPTGDFLAHTFPFYILASEDLDVIEVGPSLQRLMPALLPWTPITHYFEAVRPYPCTLTPSLMRSLGNTVIILRSPGGLSLQGEVMECESGFLILAVPVVSDISDLSRLGLTLRDFPPFDVTGDMLLLLQSTRINLRALEQATADLMAQHEELVQTRIHLERAFADALSAKQALGHSEHQHHQVASTIKEVIFRTDAKGAWAFLNPAWTSTTGFTVAESMGRPVADFVHPDDRPRLSALAGEHAQPLKGVEVRFRESSGTYRWFEINAGPLDSGKSGRSEVIGVLSDITLHHEALRLLAESTREMQAARDLAEQESRAKSEWLIALSHEIRTPLHVVLGMAEQLGDTSLTADQQHVVEVIHSNSRHLNDLVASLLDVKKIETGQFEPQPMVFSPGDILNAAVTLGRSKLRGAPVVMTSSLDASVPPHLYGDAPRLRQIIYNLVSNATKFTRAGDIRISAACAPASDSTTTLTISVADTGDGIPAADQCDIFKRYFRAGNCRQVEGTGLGLYISGLLAEQLGGSLTFTSIEGEGSCFHLATPCRPAPTEHGMGVSPDPVHTAYSLRGSTPGRRARILLVEDVPTSQELARRILSSAGFHVDVASTAAGAISCAAQCRYDVIFMDLQLPDFSGFDATQRIRAEEKRLHEAPVPIIAVTGHALASHRDECFRAGMTDYASKPLSARGFVDLATRWSDTRKTVLIADDSPDARALLVRFLRHCDVRVVEASCGLDALVQLDRQVIDLVALDVHMPDMSGVDVVRQMRLVERLHAVPVLAVTGVDSAESHHALMAGGCDSVLVKPLNSASFIQAVESALASTRRAPVTRDARPADGHDLADLVPGYLHSVEQGLHACHSSLDRLAFMDIQSVAHNIKGTGTSFGFPDLTLWARAMESAAKDMDLGRTATALDALDQALQSARHLAESR